MLYSNPTLQYRLFSWYYLYMEWGLNNESWNLKLPVALKYKIHIVYVGCTYQSNVEEKCSKYFGHREKELSAHACVSLFVDNEMHLPPICY